MDGATLNPYATPVTEVESGEQARKWIVQGSVVWVQDHAVLPPVDLEGGRTSGPLTPVMIKLPGIHQPGGGQAARPRAARGYAAVPALRTRTRRKRLRSLLFWIFAAWCWLPIIFPPGGEIQIGSRVLMAEIRMLGSMFAVPAILGIWLWGALDRGVRSGRLNNGWYPVRGIHPAALMELARRGHEPAPPLRRYKVYRVYSHRLPLRALIPPSYRWNPVMWVLMAVFKARRSPMLAQRHFHWSERVIEHASQVDPEMKESWRKKTAGTGLESWTARWSGFRDSLLPSIRSLTSVMASPDGRSFAVVCRVRASLAESLTEHEDVQFFSWTADGRVLETSSTPSLGPRPETHDFREIRGSFRTIWTAHQRRAGEVAIPLRGDQDLHDRLNAVDTESCALLQAAGILSPVEEVELPWGNESLSGPPPMPKA
ncbi:hypothetical protein [Luteolibacter soli]